METYSPKKKSLLTAVAAVILIVLPLAIALVYTLTNESVVPLSQMQEIYEDDIYLSQTDTTDVYAEEATCVVKVVELDSVEDWEEDVGGQILYCREQRMWVKVISGERKGETNIVSLDLSNSLGGKERAEPVTTGTYLLACFTEDQFGDVTGIVTGYVRQNTIIVVAVIFAFILILFTGKKGIKSVGALLITCVGLILIMVPMVLHGASPIFAAVLACVFSIAATLLIIYGFTAKTFAAALGAIGGVIVSGIFAAGMASAMHMTGLVCDESRSLALTLGDGTIDMRGLLFASVVIGALGGTIDVSISIASSLDEMRTHAPKITAVEMMGSGMNIGSDIMGASLNTLILAYVGGAIHLLMLLWVNDIALIDIVNDEIIANELMRALAGSFGLLLTVPITSIAAALLMCKGGFGKFTFDIFPAFRWCKKVTEGMRSKWNQSVERARIRVEEEEAPDDLYALASQHSGRISDSELDDADYGDDEAAQESRMPSRFRSRKKQ